MIQLQTLLWPFSTLFPCFLCPLFFIHHGRTD
jgi:hypothetical protein